MTKTEYYPIMEMQIYKIAFYPRDMFVHTIKPKVSALRTNAHIDQNIAHGSILPRY